MRKQRCLFSVSSDYKEKLYSSHVHPSDHKRYFIKCNLLHAQVMMAGEEEGGR